MRIINRNQRRKIERETKQEDKTIKDGKQWYSNLPTIRKMFIGWMIEQGVIKNENTTMSIIDECFIAAMMNELDINLKQCESVIDKSSEFMLEMKQILEKEGKRYLDMLKDEKLRSQIRNMAIEMIKGGQVMSEGVVDLKTIKDFKDVSVKDLSMIWAEAKEELKKEAVKCNVATEEEKQELLSKLQERPSISKKTNKKESVSIRKEDLEALKELTTDTELPYTVTEKEIEEERRINFEQAIAITDEKGFEIADNKSVVTIKKVSETFRGANGTIYERSEEGVRTAKRPFKDMKELKQYEQAIRADCDANLDLIEKQRQELNEREKQYRQKEYEEFNFIKEVEQVFNL